jgi:hypothetical protein
MMSIIMMKVVFIRFLSPFSAPARKGTLQLHQCPDLFVYRIRGKVVLGNPQRIIHAGIGADEAPVEHSRGFIRLVNQLKVRSTLVNLSLTSFDILRAIFSSSRIWARLGM